MHRQVVERAFGLLVARWGIFWRPLRVSVDKIPLVIRVCCKLHNICIDRFSEKHLPDPYRDDQEHDRQPGDVFEILFTDDTGFGQGYRSGKERDRCPIRETLRQHLFNLGAVRPTHSEQKALRRIRNKD